MKTLINICRQCADGALTIIDSRNLTVNIDESRMVCVVKYRGKSYDVQGNCFAEYIVI